MISILLSILIFSCTAEPEIAKKEQPTLITEESKISNKIKVLNFATFHMGSTSDANSVEFDEANKKNQEDAKEIAERIAAFKPTVVCVEVEREKNEELNAEYQQFLAKTNQASTYYGEVGLLAFEIAKKSGLEKIYGIDHKMDYNYRINDALTNTIDSLTYNSFMTNPLASAPELNIFEKGLSLKEKLSRINHPELLDLLIVINAELLTHVGTENGFEGADEAAKLYQRNLRIYSNLNRIPLTKEDRVFILSGGTHTAFLNEFMKRSPKYELVNTFDYLD